MPGTSHLKNALIPRRKTFFEGLGLLVLGILAGFLIQIFLGAVLPAILGAIPEAVPEKIPLTEDNETTKKVKEKIESHTENISKKAVNTSKDLPKKNKKIIEGKTSNIKKQVEKNIETSKKNYISLLLGIFIGNSIALLGIVFLPHIGMALDKENTDIYQGFFPKILIFSSGFLNLGVALPLNYLFEYPRLVLGLLPHGSLEYFGVLLGYTIPREGGFKSRELRLLLGLLIILVGSLVEVYYYQFFFYY